MRKLENKHNSQYVTVYSPSDLITFMESSFDSWADRYNLEFPGDLVKDPEDASLKLISDHGNKHEEMFLKHLRTQHSSVAEINDDTDLATQATLQAMMAGEEVIYQGYLSKGDLSKDLFAGRSDFLIKVPGASRLGPHHYEVWDTKLARKAKPYFVIQLCCYAEMLEAIQGIRPEYIRIVLGDNSIKSFLTRDYFDFYKNLKQQFLDFQTAWRKDHHPADSQPGPHTSWSTFADTLFAGRDDLIVVANIRQSQIKKLKAAGIYTIADLASSAAITIPKLKTETFQKLQRQAALQLQTVASGSTAFEVLPPTPGKGLAILPPASSKDVFFDMEGYPHVEGGLEYLFGVVTQDGSQTEFLDWWAHNRLEEKHAFETFIDWVYARWSQDPTMHVFHYAAYEVAALRRLAGRHATRVEQLDELLRKQVFVDLYQIVRHALQIGEPSYSIKYVEHLYAPKRTGDVAKATDSVVFYESWLEQQDGIDWRTSPILASIRDYNRDDCVSTFQLAKFLRTIQAAHGIRYTRVEREFQKPADNAASMLAEELLKSAASIVDPEKSRIQKLLAGLLEFHRREDKPKWWRALDVQQATEEELYEDLDCLQGLTRTSSPPRLAKQSLLYEYQFDPEQPTRIEAGEPCRFVHDIFTTITPAALDTTAGKIMLPVSKSRQPPPAELSLIKNEMVPTKYLAESIFRIVQSWKLSGQLPKALQDFLFRKQPTIHGIEPGEPITRSSELEEIARAVSNMRDTCLCIQGPPGAGKTTAAGFTIVKLLKSGKRVGITSNSHKAIANLLQEIANRAEKDKVALKAIQVCSKDGGYELVPGVSSVESSSKLFSDSECDKFNLVAGTAWVFSNPRAEKKFDYLFVDEAGQVCLANVVSMSQSARNIVLLGDQQQLEQPVQGSHPADVDKSALEYILQDHATIPSNLGIFLDVSRRMHPRLCQFISASVYDGRLTADPSNDRQVLLPPQALAARFPRNAGIVWVPCAHDGNAQSSSEEAEAIELLVNDLLRCRFSDKAGSQRAIQLSDIIIVAPYNLQAKLISKRLPGARVASVDKFQGSEAPIVILSMCASDGRNSPRGLEFLFSRSRLNVALSRAKSLAFVVGNPGLVNTACSTLEQMRLINFFCQIVEYGAPEQHLTADEPERREMIFVPQLIKAPV